MRQLVSAYYAWILRKPRRTLGLLALLLAAFTCNARDVRVDTSASSFLPDDDPDLVLLRELTDRYQDRELLLVAFTPREPLFSNASLLELRRMRDAIARIPAVESVMTILDAPLLESSDTDLARLLEQIPTLETPGVDRERARAELTQSPVFSNFLVSHDGQTTGLLVTLHSDIRHLPDPIGSIATTAQLRSSVAWADFRHAAIEQIRSALDPFRQHGLVCLGGTQMIADDMVAFVHRDMLVFGFGIFVAVLIVLAIIFRELCWVVLPLLSCAYAVGIILGVVGLVGWELTVVSSNFLALLLIMTISMNVQLAIRYRQLRRERPSAAQDELVMGMIRKMYPPCLSTALTATIAFGSLIFSDVRPIRDFGWIMSCSLGVALLTSFTVFPVTLVLWGKPSREREYAEPFLGLLVALARWTTSSRARSLAAGAFLLCFSCAGIPRLSVENSFINFFKQDTEIYRGMRRIDEQLGGTTSLQVLLHLDGDRLDAERDALAPPASLDEASGPSEDPDLEDWGDPEDAESATANWFTPSKIERIKNVHDYLQALPEVGKVLSLASTVRVAERVNGGRELEGLELALLYKRMPADMREKLVDPYASVAHGEARILLRVRDSNPSLQRNELLERIERDFRERLGLENDEFTLAGPLVLYNNMLQGLYASQIFSFAGVIAGIFLMLLLVFGSPSLCVIALIPSLLASMMLLGAMGLAGIPLDMMTVTIASITSGISVDNAIYYLFRFREEFARTKDYEKTVLICHANVGCAIFYTSSTIIAGFSILMFSEFVPTIYFGALTALAMLAALVAGLTILPKLILVWQPFR